MLEAIEYSKTQEKPKQGFIDEKVTISFKDFALHGFVEAQIANYAWRCFALDFLGRVCKSCLMDNAPTRR